MGGFALLKVSNKFNGLIKAWLFFYGAYYCLATLGNAIFGTEPYKFLVSLIPVSYFISFSILLSIPEERKPFARLATITFLFTTILTILFAYFNISFDVEGLTDVDLQRAGGVFGDANNASVAAILTFLLVKYCYNPTKRFHKILKNIALLLSVYAVALTFSKTGFLIFALVLIITYRQLLSPKRIMFTLIILPPLLYFAYNWAVSGSSLTLVQKERVQTLVNLVTLNTDQVDYSSRDVLLKNMFGYIEQNPFIGHGIQFSNSIRGHNTIIGIWADTGIIGFLIFLAVLAYFFKKAIEASGWYRPFAISVLITICMFMITLQTIINQPYLMVMFVFIAYLVNMEEVEEYT